jgi:hypothetical protein
MTERIVQRRQGKKRNIARIFDAMYGLNAVYPEVQPALRPSLHLSFSAG